MTTQIDFRILPLNVPSLCIPRVFSNIDEKRIRRIFNELSMGEIERIDMVSKTTDKGEKFNRVFVHFKRWFSNENADTARERLINGKEIKIIYDDPWFWKVSAYREANKARPSSHTGEKHAQKKPTLQFDSDEDKPKPNHYSRDTDEFGRSKSMRPRDQRPPRDQRLQRPPRDQRPPREQRQEMKKVVPRTPSNSPPRQRGRELDLDEQEEQIPVIDYGTNTIPVKRRKIVPKKQELKIEAEENVEVEKTVSKLNEEKEEGEI